MEGPNLRYSVFSASIEREREEEAVLLVRLPLYKSQAEASGRKCGFWR
jgi:hypothetical protein